MTNKAKVVIVAAISRNKRALGNKNSLLWHIPEDLKRFKTLTAQHPVVMGRKTFESILAILGKPLPERINIVVTRDANFSYPGVLVVSSVDEGLCEAEKIDHEEIHIGGGAQIYEQVLPHVDELRLTLVDDEPTDADTFFPAFEDEFEPVTSSEVKVHEGLSYQWIDYRRKKATS